MRRCFPGGMIVLLLLGACSAPPTPPKGALTRVEGRVVAPVEGVLVDVYRPGEDLRGPPFLQLGPLGEDASFSLDLPAGKYLLVARKRQDAQQTGPVREGDIKTDPVPVTVVPGEPLTLDLFAHVKRGNTKQPFGASVAWTAGLEGRVVDAEGAPVEGVRVHVYDHIQMSERPKFVSARTGPDGVYKIGLPEGGTYYICARDKYGGPPAVGELYGRYDQGTIDPSAVIVEDGATLKGVDITVHKVW